VPGGEVSGTVIAVGKSVAQLAVGDIVLAVLPRFGGFAEEVRAAATDCFKLPPVRYAQAVTVAAAACHSVIRCVESVRDTGVVT
jgi:NADPH:quinone reductase-like Zn-dependent oxidoreductase